MTENAEAQQLIASLTAVQADGVYDLDGGDKYIDWSTRDERSGRYAFEVGGDGETATIWTTRDDLLRLHAALTATLLRDVG